MIFIPYCFFTLANFKLTITLNGIASSELYDGKYINHTPLYTRSSFATGDSIMDSPVELELIIKFYTHFDGKHIKLALKVSHYCESSIFLAVKNSKLK